MRKRQVLCAEEKKQAEREREREREREKERGVEVCRQERDRECQRDRHTDEETTCLRARLTHHNKSVWELVFSNP